MIHTNCGGKAYALEDRPAFKCAACGFIITYQNAKTECTDEQLDWRDPLILWAVAISALLLVFR